MSKSHQRPWNIARKPISNNPPTFKAVGQPAWKRKVASVSRWLHIYLSMVSFVIVFFFAVTGLTLNHATWFEGNEQTADHKGKLTPTWVNTTDTAKVAKLAIVEFLRNTHGIKGAVSDFRIEDDQCSIAFKGPGYSADAFVTRETGEYELSETRLGLVAVMNDLHKGRDSGSGWSWVIDVSAVLMSLVSLTGIVLILFLKRKRVSGLVIALVGAIICYAIYAIFVP